MLKVSTALHNMGAHLGIAKREPLKGISRREPLTKIFLGFEKINLEVMLSYAMSSRESLREVS